MSNTGDNYIIPSDNKVTITIKNIPYDKEEHYKLGRRLGKFIFDSTTGGFWRGLAEYVTEEQTREYNPSGRRPGWHWEG